MKVEAIRMGFIHNERKRVGVHFIIEDHEFSENWMKKISDAKKIVERKPSKKESLSKSKSLLDVI